MVFHGKNGKKPWFSMEKNHGFPCLLNGIMEKNHGKCPNHDHGFPWKTMVFFHGFPWLETMVFHGKPWLETMVFHVC